MNKTVVISKDEYRRLRSHAKAYQKLVGQLFQSVITGSVDAVVEDFRKTGLYTEPFLKDLKEGLEKSSYSRR